MAKKRRRPHNRPRSQTGTPGAVPGSGRPGESRTEPDERSDPGRTPRSARARTDPHGGARPQAAPAPRGRAEKKELARRQREDVRRRVRRRRVVSRGVRIAIVAALALGVVLFLTRAGAPSDVPESAVNAAEAAGCGEVQAPVAEPQRGHLAPGETITYEQQPATSGDHAPAPLPADPHVYTSPVEETAAVHNLEHAYVLIYYRAEGANALPQGVLDELARLAESEEKVIMAPYPSLDDRTSLALAAWNKLWECPADVTPGQARTIASGFIEAYRGTSNAPEPQGA